MKNSHEDIELSFSDIFKSNYIESQEFRALEQPKFEISKKIRDALNKKGLSLRKVSNIINDMKIDDYKASYSQIARVTSGENYNINTLLKILDVLDLEITIKSKE